MSADVNQFLRAIIPGDVFGVATATAVVAATVLISWLRRVAVDAHAVPVKGSDRGLFTASMPTAPCAGNFLSTQNLEPNGGPSRRKTPIENTVAADHSRAVEGLRLLERSTFKISLGEKDGQAWWGTGSSSPILLP